MSCVACHSPHEPLDLDMAAYDGICKQCHAAAQHRQAIAGTACAQCHMPPVRLDNLVFTNHRIGVYGSASPLVPVNARPAR